MTNINKGIDKWQALVNTLNDIIKAEGRIDINNPRIWEGYLHQYKNKDWEEMLEAFGELLIEHPEFFESFHKKNFKTTAEALLDNPNNHKRILDTKPNKRKAWAMIMSMREVWNNATGKNIPNGGPKLNNYNQIFHSEIAD